MANDLGITPFGRTSPGVQGSTPVRSGAEIGAPPETGVKQGTQAQADTARLEAVALESNELVHELQRELHFAVDHNSGDTIIKVVDRETEEVIRQIPSEEVVRLRQRLEEVAGVLFDGSA